ncbi:MAG TPA: acyl-CoA dehydrogenase family protein [Candidatus Binataceae bacterium]|nr:acyl-CoA dehydrogenase family protein [Candidatus Binataceae bacterium]
MSTTLSSEQKDLQARARALADNEFRVRAAEIDRTEQYPIANVQSLVRERLMGLTIAPEFGGGGRPLIDAILVIEQIARVCGTTARIVVEGNAGAVSAIGRLGSEAQKKRYLPWVSAGEKPAIAITEKEAGSAATQMRTSARREGDVWIVDGGKCWITGAGSSRLYLVFARFDDKPGAGGIGALMIERDAPGFRIGRREPAMGLRGLPEGELIFERCRVPSENVLVGAGGFKTLMSAYNCQRVGAATVAMGIAQGAFEEAVRFAQERRQFDRPIAGFQGLRWMFADMAVQLEAARLLIYRAATNAGHGFPDRQEAALAKLFAAESAIVITNNALQIFGARGYSRDLPMERMVRDARMFTIGGGTAQIMRNIIAAEILGPESGE